MYEYPSIILIKDQIILCVIEVERGKYMLKKDYIGCCGSCIDCNLNDSYTVLYTTKFKCTRYNRYVKADEQACSRFEPAKNRTNELIAKYDK